MREAKREAMRQEMMHANEAQIAVKAQTDLKMKAEEDVRPLDCTLCKFCSLLALDLCSLGASFSAILFAVFFSGVPPPHDGKICRG